jgi:ADP-ribose pyrophosphatase YjhB (NUDIX family)
MAHYAYGERLGRTAQLKLGCAAMIPNDTGKHMVLTRRTENSPWCVPGGAMDPGETLEECCRGEVWEETGLFVRVVRLIGISSTPHRVTSYADGHRWQTVSVTFLTAIMGGARWSSATKRLQSAFSPWRRERSWT